MISASPIAGCPSFKFLTMQMQPSASCARMWTVLSATIMFADKPHRLNERTSAQRFCVLTILPPVTALAVGLPAQRAIAQRFRALALNGLAISPDACLLLLRVSDAGRSRRCGLHRGRRPKAFNEGTRGKWQAVAPRAPSAMEVCARRRWVRATDADECVG